MIPAKLLPIPGNALYEIPDPGPEDFFNPKGEEDDDLLALGEWADVPEDEIEEGGLE